MTRKNKQSFNNNYKSEKTGFLKNHIDTFAIMGLNIAIAGLLVSLYVSNSSNITAANSRMDTMQGLIFQENKDFHGRLCAIEERNKK